MKTESVGDDVSAGRGAGWVRLKAPARWEELVLPDASRELLRSISGDLRTLASGRRRADGRSEGLKLLFAGEPGTGKRLATRILAAELGLAIFNIDLANVFSRDRMETERRLDRLFAAADDSPAIVYFADAETWFAARAQGWRSEDPSADMEVAALLRRIDKYRGVVVFAATLGIARAAVIERLDFVVEFPFPDAGARRKIWRLLLPAGARLNERELDFLAASFQLPGGAIQRCCIAAASAAAGEGVPVELRHVIGGVEQEYRGRLQGDRTREALERFHARTWADEPLAATPAPAQSRVAAHGRLEHAGRRLGPGNRLLALLVLGGVAAAAALGFLIARAGTSPSGPPALDRHAAAGLLRVSFPNGWRQRTPPSSPRLGLTDELALAPTGAAGVLVIGRTGTPDPSLLPTSLLVALPTAPTPQIVTLAGERFYRYLNLSSRGAGGPESVYALPTSIGTVLGLCLTQGTGAGFASSCERIIGTIRLASGSVVGVGPSASYASSLNPVITKLNTARSAAGARLGSARTAGDQAKAADELATAYLDAASAVPRLNASTARAANQAVAAALLASGHAYAALASAAARNDASGYRAASRSVTRAASALSAALSHLARLGYAVG